MCLVNLHIICQSFVRTGLLHVMKACSSLILDCISKFCLLSMLWKWSTCMSTVFAATTSVRGICSGVRHHAQNGAGHS